MHSRYLCSVGYALSLTHNQSDLIPFHSSLFLSLFQMRVVVVLLGGERLWMTQVIGNLGHRVMLLHPLWAPLQWGFIYETRCRTIKDVPGEQVSLCDRRESAKSGRVSPAKEIFRHVRYIFTREFRHHGTRHLTYPIVRVPCSTIITKIARVISRYNTAGSFDRYCVYR